MKKLLLFAFALICAISSFAHDLEVDGIYYNITSPTTVEVTYQGSSYNSNSNRYTGNVVIPNSVSIGAIQSVAWTGNWTQSTQSGAYNGVKMTSNTISHNGSTVARCTFRANGTITFRCRYQGESNYDYLTIGGLDGTCSRTTYATTLEGTSGTWTTVSFTVTDDSEHFVEFCYSKDGSNTTYPDCAEVYILESGDYDVISIGAYAFKGCSGLTNVTIPNSVTSIGNKAFEGCSGLTSMTIPNSVTSIGNDAFCGCSGLTNVTIPNSVTSIGNVAFYGCSGLTSITIPNSVTSIGDKAFYNCSNLNSAYIGNSVISIGADAFRSCPHLYKVIMLPNSVPTGINNAFEARNGRITYVGNNNFSSYASVLGTVKVYTNLSSYFVSDGIVYTLVNPSQRTCEIIDCDYSKDAKHLVVADQVSYRNVALNVIGANSYAFCYNENVDSITVSFAHNVPTSFAIRCSKLKYVNLSNSGSIGNNAFQNSSTVSPAKYVLNNTGSIGTSAFEGCTKMDSLIVTNNVTSIGSRSFYGCSGLTSVSLSNIGNIGTYAFQNSSTLTPATYDIHTKGSIAQQAFSGCNKMEQLCVDSTVTTIDTKAFYQCSGLISVELNNKGNIGDNAFQNSSTSSPAKYILNNVGSIGIYTFGGCSAMDTLIVTNNVTNLGSRSFSGCSGLTSVSLANLGNIGTYAFQNSSTLTPATYDIHTTGAIEQEAFSGCNKMEQLYVDSTVTTINTKAFYQCSGLTSVKLNNRGNIGDCTFQNSSTSSPAKYILNNVGNINTSAFEGCTRMDSLIVTNNVRGIGNRSFYGCSGLASVSLSNNGNIYTSAFQNSSTQTSAKYDIHTAGSIRQNAFRGCSKMEQLYVDSTVVAIGDTAFYQCSGLISVELNNKGNIGDYAFQSSSTSSPAKYILNNVGTIGTSSFGGCSKLNRISLGNKVTSLGNNAFKSCALLDSVVIPSSVLSIGNSTFYGCSNLTSIEIGDHVSTIGTSAFENCSALPNIFIPKSVSSIGNTAFDNCTSLATVSFEDGPTSLSLGYNASSQGMFYDCPLDSLYIGRELSYNKNSLYGYSPFYRNNTLRSIVMTDQPTKIEENEFYGCTSLYYVSIGNGVTSIGNYAFSGCSAIDYFGFGRGVTTIGAEAFSDCVNMTTLRSFCDVPPTCGASALEDVNKWACTLIVPTGKTSAYASAPQWQDFFFVEEEQGEQYLITFVNYDGSELQADSLYNGMMPQYNGPTPTKPATAQYTYTFKGWNPAITQVVAAATYTAEFDSIVNQYTITFLNYDGTTLQTSEVEYGQVPAYNGTTPTKAATAEYTYSFAGWTPEVVAVTGDATYTATYSSTVNQYTITVIGENCTITGDGTYDYGTEVTLTVTPDEGYLFVEWSDGLADAIRQIIVVEDATYIAHTEKQSIATGQQENSLSEQVQKIFDGTNYYILRGGKRYTMQGAEVK